MFKASIVDSAARSCGRPSVTCRGGNPRTRWLTLGVKEAVELKKRAVQAWLALGSPETAEGYQLNKRPTAVVVVDAELGAWEEFAEATEKDFWLSSRKF